MYIKDYYSIGYNDGYWGREPNYYYSQMSEYWYGYDDGDDDYYDDYWLENSL